MLIIKNEKEDLKQYENSNSKKRARTGKRPAQNK